VSRMVRAYKHDEEEITSLDRAVGTVEYMAPEQILSSRDALPSADLYSVGAILFRAISGRNVFGDLRGSSLARHKLISDAPRLSTGRLDPLARGLENVVARALSLLPEDRYQVADAMIDDLVSLKESVADRASGVRVVGANKHAEVLDCEGYFP
jgi:eukaryotic-like serine/threonine-protein kinase